jgi:hypothetical protein
MRESIFKDEAELCAAFIKWAKREGYTCYPETAGFDLLLVGAEGFQTGIQAKMSLNAKVISQILPLYSLDEGPDYRAVLVPSLRGDFREICGHIGIDIFYCQHGGRRDDWRPGTIFSFSRDGAWHFGENTFFDWNPIKRCDLPAYMPDVAAGVPSPIQLTPWKIGALKVLAHLEIAGHITRKRINALGIDSRRWCGGEGWLLPLAGDPARGGRYVRGKCPAFDQQHPEVYAQIKAELIAAGALTDEQLEALV